MTPEQKAYSAGYEAARKQAVTVAHRFFVRTDEVQVLRPTALMAQEDRSLVVNSCKFAIRCVSRAIATMTPEKADD